MSAATQDETTVEEPQFWGRPTLSHAEGVCYNAPSIDLIDGSSVPNAQVLELNTWGIVILHNRPLNYQRKLIPWSQVKAVYENLDHVEA